MDKKSIEIDSKLFAQFLQQMKPLETFSGFFKRQMKELQAERALREYLQRFVPKDVLEQYAPIIFGQENPIAYWYRIIGNDYILLNK
jgi:hypothetical protein